jgi:protein involved in polysaccharide export with SLBB domain
MKRFIKIISKSFLTLLAIVVACSNASGADIVIPVAPKPVAPQVFAGSNAKTRAAWQTHLTLGPNDSVSFSFYGRPELARANVLIGPDGRVNYLQAQGVMAAGLTIDELRDKMTEELAKYYRQPSVMVSPGEFRSKKIYILGKVVNKGVYALDRPLTVIEAIAQAGGLETGIYQLNTVELADLPRSFLIRDRKRVPVDFEKLFRKGDLTQNILLEPDDYLYFPSAGANEIYVLGSVKSPGPQGLAVDACSLGAITLAGGFTERAYQQKVLVVRGSLDNPQRFIVNTKDILAGKATDFRLEPHDIIYVSDHPWSRVEDLADMAATSFIQTMVTVWTGGSISPLITSPIVPMIH